MAKSNFLTDKFSTTGGLAAVAYGSSSLFPAVADQIKRRSKTRALDSQRPSHAFLDFVGTRKFVLDVFKSVFEEEYNTGEIITDFIDLYAHSVDNFSETLLEIFLYSIDEYSTYSISPSGIFAESIEKTMLRFDPESNLDIDFRDLTIKIQNKFIELGYIGEDVSSVLVFLINNPNTKLSEAPPDNLIQLEAQSTTTKDSKGVERNYGTLSPQKYYNGAAYNTDPSAFKKSVVQGYVGYPLVSLLGESILNQDSYENLDLDYIGSSVLSNIQDNSNLSPTERAIYNLNLATLDLGTN